MSLPLAGYILIFIAVLGGVVAMGAFIWAVRTKQFKDLNAGAYIIFDEEEPVGKMTDKAFLVSESQKPINDNKKER